jgi:PilZ domain-containing protein
VTVADQALSSWRSERRTERRYTHRLDKPAYAILEDGSYADVRLLDLTYEGCSIDCTTELKPGDRVRLSVHGRGVIEAEVRHYSNGQAGLAFRPDTGPKEHWPRRGIRVRLSADVSLRRSGKAAFKVTVFDISPYGCKVEFIERPSMDEHVWIRFPGLEPIEGEVCWVDQPTAGVSFAKSIHPAVFDLLLERLRETMR